MRDYLPPCKMCYLFIANGLPNQSRINYYYDDVVVIIIIVIIVIIYFDNDQTMRYVRASLIY